MIDMPARRRPTTISAGIAIGLALLTVAILHRSSDIWSALALETLGLGALAAGILLFRYGRRTLGTAAVIGGMGSAVLAILAVATGGHHHAVLLVVLPGMIGSLLIAIGVFPLVGEGSRRLVGVGAGCAFVGVLVAGVIGTSAPALVGAAIAVVLAWDTGEHAITVGEQVTAAGATRAIEASHVGASGLVGVGAYIIALGIGGVGSIRLTFAQLAVLLVAAVCLMLALYE